MVIAVVEAQGNAFRWNLTTNVGPGQPNRLDDVELVRFGYLCVKQNNKFPADPAVKDALTTLRPMGPFDDDLANVIAVHQSVRGGTQDGIVSVAKVSFTSTNGERYDGINAWIIVSLNNNMLDVVGDVYPRIDLPSQVGPKAGPEVSRLVKEILIGASS